ncbi:uncharacterized protein LOC130604998 isoform X1 [Pezoporus wallicus]|uniref:uncharacterized protein LOC130604998 isoform X1 n=1 Tax=Pezoporus wallicus TaxID=35540 RepID=UPI00254ED23C|nr:uncharacterized protein LOC130604998 isoform X1 [Pezoporus wallicus]
MHTQQVLGLKCLCTEERGKEVSEACPKGTVRPILWQITDFTRKFLEAINRKWLSKSRWSMLTAGTTQEIAERLNGCKKNALLLRPWQSQYIHSSSSSSFTALISPSYKVSQSANTFCLCNLLSLNQQGRAGTFCLGGNGQEGFTSCAKDDSETPSNNHCLSGALGLRSKNSIAHYFLSNLCQFQTTPDVCLSHQYLQRLGSGDWDLLANILPLGAFSPKGQVSNATLIPGCAARHAAGWRADVLGVIRIMGVLKKTNEED